ncbi:Hypothetical predicted protein [Pelobates cultripes]|uniref:Uncharacterized protein n=1 Tax=Pelobates cultripes TaxID=61616 RepID=A0AAD1W4Z1_PELCU|nr:Hypothetical predicted protein [Pelobates cultripes]
MTILPISQHTHAIGQPNTLQKTQDLHLHRLLPFFLLKNAPSRKRRPWAYTTRETPDWGTLLSGVYDTWDPANLPEPMPEPEPEAQMAAMGRRSQKQNSSSAHQDIGALLQKQAQPKMAPAESTPAAPPAAAPEHSPHFKHP